MFVRLIAKHYPWLRECGKCPGPLPRGSRERRPDVTLLDRDVISNVEAEIKHGQVGAEVNRVHTSLQRLDHQIIPKVHRRAINTAGNADQAARRLKELRRELEQAGDNPPPGLLMKIQIATQAYQAWFTCLKSCADSKGQVQGELARFR